MLISLSVRDFVIVDALELDFTEGFTVLTGETGAGKSILLDALSLLLGDRAEGGEVREGADRAELAAVFDIARLPALAAWLASHDLAGEDDELLIRRALDKNGRSRAQVNGRIATLAQLREIGEHLLDIHGQHAHQSLVRADTQRGLLDAYAGALALASDVADAWQDWQHARRAREDAERLSRESEVERERLTWQIGELAELALTADEWKDLNQQHSRLANAVELTQSAQHAVDALSEMDGNCLSLLGLVQNRLSRLAGVDPRLAETLALLDSVDAELREVVYSLRDYASGLDEDPAELVRIEVRIDQAMSLARKYRCQPQDLPEKLADWQQQLDQLEASADQAALAVAEQAALARYRTQAESLSAKRRQAAGELSGRISREMHHLAMGGARFAIELSALADPTAHGMESVEYLVAANAGATLRPLAKVASGGELSRISLAMQVVISQVASVPTLIFDEVDVGIGGRVAEVVGKLLKELGRRYQVLAITHLPQVASCGDAHWRVAKRDEGGRTVSRISVLDTGARVDELARMLGGEAITDTTRQHAAEMLEANA
ncbi:DNA repair protein RecN [Crenobacter intestini]|uniref:DNA repair protein RecN n=1 Tax=Crenobacter intestini TaxID=2563443 RepID=A0A4T0V5Q9_9NEIS|nr:DNA repair protein RecN [Crenobacter intestini]TIC87094.1 DNA repair protein RecN [Crenobacter intestini]